MQSILIKYQTKEHGPVRLSVSDGYGAGSVLTATVRYDDECGNGHNSFTITGDIRGEYGFEAGGFLHDEIAKYFPDLAPLIKWHLVATDGPMHYLANTEYHVQNGRLDYARDAAVWPEATDEQLTAPGLRDRLLERLPALMADFKLAVDSLGFFY